MTCFCFRSDHRCDLCGKEMPPVNVWQYYPPTTTLTVPLDEPVSEDDFDYT